jgi:diaminohydroxyphosphoribosylaminopyrimidine deaminase/5-amino-6-(5-phosphoribosylamino)uracil reductase
VTAQALDERHMALALSLGERNLGLTWPNPSVGAVVVDETGPSPLLIAQGATQPGGRPHAERVALAQADDQARGKTLYVSLEPCSHHGKSPPCVEAIVTAGIRRVVSSLEDADRRVAGNGHALLRQAGIIVDVGCLRERAARAHRGHFLRVTQGRPAIDLKLARTTEGFAGARSGPRLMITGETANARVHLMRAHADGIMVGIGTVLADNPLLDVRLPGMETRSPVRIVIDSHLRMPETARLRDTSRVPTWVISTVHASLDAEKALVGQGVEVMRVSATADGSVDLTEAMQLLGTRGMTRIFCEGGPGLADALARADLVDELTLMTGRSARGSGGSDFVPALGRALQDRMASMRLVGEEQIGPDLFMHWEREPCLPAS